MLHMPARHMWETGSLNWPQFMFLWFRFRFPEFTGFSFHLWKTSLAHFVVTLITILDFQRALSCGFKLEWIQSLACFIAYTFMGFLYLPTGLLAVSMTDWYLLPHIFSSRDRRQSLAYQPKHSNSHFNSNCLNRLSYQDQLHKVFQTNFALNLIVSKRPDLGKFLKNFKKLLLINFKF